MLLFSISAFSQTEKSINFLDLKTASRSSGYTSYTSMDGAVYKVGDKLKIGFPSNGTFAFITEGDGILLPITNLKSSSSNTETEIKSIVVAGSKNSGYYVSFRTKGATGMPGSGYTISVENAISAGELKSFGMSSDEALAELKKAKDKLELELITQAQYDQIKLELMKFIK